MGYAYRASVTIPAATGSTLTNFTALITGLDARLKTVANSGQIQNTVTRVGQTVPADLILSSDVAGTSLYSWGWDFYDPTTGAVKIWVLIPSHSNSASTTIYINFGNSAVNTYQGGSQGAEFDSNTKAVYHFPNGTILSVKDFSSNSNDITNPIAVGATTGQIDGAAGTFDGSTQYLTKNTAVVTATPVTLSAWAKATNAPTGGGSIIVLYTTLDDNTWIRLAMQGGKVYGDRNTPSYASATGVTSLSSGVWYYLTVTLDGSTLTVYLNGSFESSSAYTGSNTPNSTAIGRINAAIGAYFGGSIDEARLINSTRSANWIATEYANQLSPPSITGFTSLVVLSDTFTIAETISKKTSKSIAEIYTFIETISKKTTKSPAEIFTLLETLSKSTTRNITEDFNPSDSFRLNPTLQDWYYVRQFLSDPESINSPSTETVSTEITYEDLDYFKGYL